MLNWGVLAAGLVLFSMGCHWMMLHGRRYKAHVLRYGRVKFGKKYGTSWVRADTTGAILGLMYWIVGIPVLAGVLLFFFTGLPQIGIPLWIGSTLGIAGLFLLFLAFILSAGLAKRETEIALRHMQGRHILEGEEQHQDDNSD